MSYQNAAQRERFTVCSQLTFILKKSTKTTATRAAFLTPIYVEKDFIL